MVDLRQVERGAVPAGVIPRHPAGSVSAVWASQPGVCRQYGGCYVMFMAGEKRQITCYNVVTVEEQQPPNEHKKSLFSFLRKSYNYNFTISHMEIQINC